MDLNDLLQALQMQQQGIPQPQHSQADIMALMDQARVQGNTSQRYRNQPWVYGDSGLASVGSQMMADRTANRAQEAQLEALKQAYNAQSGIDQYQAQMQAIAQQQADIQKRLLDRSDYEFEQQNKAVTPTVAQRNAESMGLRPGTPEYNEYMRQATKKGGVTVNTGNDGPQVGTIPQGFQLAKDETGAYRMEPIPGGPPDMERQAAEEKSQAGQETKSSRADDVLSAIGRARKLIGFTTTGLPGQILDEVGGTDAKTLKVDLDTIKANLGFDRLTQMREESKTGGALGQVSNIELQLLTSAVAGLDNTLKGEALDERLDVVEKHYQNFVDALNGKMPANYKSATVGGKTYLLIDGEWVES